MPYDFPDSPVLDETVSSPDGTTYYWDGTKWTLAAVSSALVNWTVTEAGTVPGAYTIVNTTSGVEHLAIVPTGTVTFKSDIGLFDGLLYAFKDRNDIDQLTINDQFVATIKSMKAGLYYIGDNCFAQAFGNTATGEGTFVIFNPGLEGAIAIHEAGHPSFPNETHYKAIKHIFGPVDINASYIPSGVEYGWWNAEGLSISGQPDFDVAGTFKDANLRLTANAQSWDLIGATPDSGSAPGAFIIADATRGDRRLVIEPFIPNPNFPNLPGPGPARIFADGHFSLATNVLLFDGATDFDNGCYISGSGGSFTFSPTLGISTSMALLASDRMTNIFRFSETTCTFYNRVQVYGGSVTVQDEDQGVAAQNYYHPSDYDLEYPITTVTRSQDASTPGDGSISFFNNIYNFRSRIDSVNTTAVDFGTWTAAGLNVIGALTVNGVPVGGASDSLPLTGGTLTGDLVITPPAGLTVDNLHGTAVPMVFDTDMISVTDRPWQFKDSAGVVALQLGVGGDIEIGTTVRNAMVKVNGSIKATFAYFLDDEQVINNEAGRAHHFAAPYIASGDSFRIVLHTVSPGTASTGMNLYRAMKHAWSRPATGNSYWFEETSMFLDDTGLTIKWWQEPSYQAGGLRDDNARLHFVGLTQTWDVTGAATNEFVITDATTDVDRLIIRPGAVAGTIPVEITAAGDLLVQGVAVGGGGMDEPVGAGSFGRTQNGTWDAVLSLLTGGEIAAGIDLRSGPLGQGLRLTQYGVYGDANTAPGGYGRNLNIYAGDGTYGGNVSLLGGKGTGNKGGNINLTGGQTDVMMGGDATLAGGFGGVNAQGGNAYLLGGDGMMAGYCRITGGDASRNNGVGGTIEIDGGKADVGLTAGGGVVWIRGGGAIAGNGGDINIRGGEGGASGGDLLFTGGRAMVAGGIPGNIRFQPGDNGVDGTLGLVFLENLPTTAPALEAALWNNAGVVSIVPSVAGDPPLLDTMRAEIDRLSARLAALEGGGGASTPPATPAPRTPPPAPTAAPTAPARRPPPRR